MRVIKGFVLFCFSIVLVSSCFDPPEFSDIPRITFKSIKFKEVGGVSDYDSLILVLDFKDGNGDVGLSSQNPDDTEPPYHYENYFVEDEAGSGDTIPVLARVVGGVGTPRYTIINPTGNGGKLVTSRTRSKPNYAYLPVLDPTSCVNYSYLLDVLVPFTNVDATYDIKDTVTFSGTDYALLNEYVLFKRNPNHYNIEITFERFQNGSFIEYDWFEEYCTTYNGRFATSVNASPTYPNRPVEGSIRYSMANSSFLAIFGNTPIRIKARIRDRALHESNQVQTPEFELNEIR